MPKGNPQICWHKHTCRWYVRIKGKQIYLSAGVRRTPKPPPEVVAAFHRLLSKFHLVQAEPKPQPISGDPTITEVWAAYLIHCETYYVKNGQQTSEIWPIKTACRLVARLFGEDPARLFTAQKLKLVRDEMIRLGWSRLSINKQVNRIRGMFRWAAEHELVSHGVWHGLQTVKALAKGRTTAIERKRVAAVPWATVEVTLPHLPPTLADMVRVHRLLGCRAEDVVAMRVADLDRPARGLWAYTLASWKTEHLEGQPPVYWIGPQARAIIAKLIKGKSSADYVFPHGKGWAYTTASYRRAVARVCIAKKLPRWSPIQIRHLRLTEIRKGHGIEAAQAVGKHRQIETTQIYAERQDALAKEAALAMG